MIQIYLISKQTDNEYIHKLGSFLKLDNQKIMDGQKTK